MCGILGVVATTPVNQLLYDGLMVLQHRGQDAAGIATGDGEALNLNVWKDPSGNGAQITAIIAFIGLLAYFVWESFRAKEDQD